MKTIRELSVKLKLGFSSIIDLEHRHFGEVNEMELKESDFDLTLQEIKQLKREYITTNTIIIIECLMTTVILLFYLVFIELFYYYTYMSLVTCILPGFFNVLIWIIFVLYIRLTSSYELYSTKQVKFGNIEIYSIALLELHISYVKLRRKQQLYFSGINIIISLQFILILFSIFVRILVPR